MLKKLNIFLLFLILVLPSNLWSSTLENRIILDEDFLWLTPTEANKLIRRIKQAGFNILIPCVWHGRGVSWISTLAPQEPKWTGKKLPRNYDPLAYLVSQARREGIDVHPLFTFSLRQRDFLEQFYDKYKSPIKSFDVHREEFQKFMIDLILEVVSKYDVNGINLDYMRTKGTCACTDCIKDYRKYFNRDLVSDIRSIKTSQQAKATIAMWNSIPIENFLQNLNDALKSIDKNIIISCDSHPGNVNLLLEGTDSIKWVNNGWCDYVLSMDYGQDLKSNLFLDKFLIKDPSKVIIMIGNYERSGHLRKNVTSRNATKVLSLMHYSKLIHPSHDAIALYCYKYLDDLQIDLIRKNLFPTDTIPNLSKKPH